MSNCSGDFTLEINETKYTVEIETCVNSTGVNNITVQNVSGVNLDINTNCVNPDHPTISAASSVDNNGSLFIQDILLDSYGHVTGISSAYATGTGIGGGSSNFLDLSDTPSTFSGQAGKYVAVNSGESALEFVTETDPIFTGSVAYNISSSDTGNWNTAYGWGNHATGGYLISGDNISLLNNNVPYALSGSHIDITGASNVDNTGNVFVQDILMDQYGHVTGIRTASATGEGADNYYVTGASFNSGNNHLVLTRTDGGTVTGILSGVVVSGSDYHISVNGTGVSESGRTYVQDILVDSYGHITGIVTATETVVDTNTEYSDGVGLSLSGTVFSIDDTVIQSGDNISLLNNDSGYINTETDPVFTGSAAYNITTGNISNWNDAYSWGDHSLSGYITGYTETGLNTFVTGLAFDSGTNNLVLQRNDSVSITGQLDGVLVSGTSYHISVDGTGVDGSGRTYVQDILVDSYGHITGINTATETVVDTNTETLTVLSGSSINTGLYYTDESGTTNFISLSWAIDDTNLARLVSGSIDSSGIATFERDDATSFTVDFSALFDDTNLSRITSGNFDTSSGILTLTRELDDTSISVDFDGRYATTGELSSVSGYLQGQIDGVDTNTFVTGISYNSSTHELTLIRNSGSVTGVLSNIIHSGDNVSLLVNDAGYLTGLVGATGSFDYIDFTNLEEADYPSHLEGRLFYDSGNHALAYYNDETEVTLQIGQEEFLRVRNNTTGTITNGSLVYITGSHANAAAAIDLAIATSDAESAVAGFATHDIEASTFGYVTTFGMVRDVSTSGISAGSEIYLSNTTSGAFTDTSPTVPNYSMPVGYVIREHATNGSILAFIGKHKLGGGDLKSEATAILSGIPFVTTVADNNGGGLTTSTGLVYDSGNQNLYVGGSEVLVSGDSISQLANDTGYLTGVVDDTTPKLGGNLDAQSNQITAVSKLEITNTSTDDSLLITTTEDSSSAAPVLTFKRNSTSPNDADYIGQLKFKGENDADQEVVYAKVTAKISDVTDTTEDGLLEFALRKAGSNNIGMRLTSTDLKLLNGTEMDMGSQQIHNVLDPTSAQDAATKNYCDTNFTDGSGAANYVAKWSDADTLTSGIIYDDGSGVGIGTTSPTEKLEVSGNIKADSFNAGGTSSQFLKADGSVDSNTYLTSVTSAWTDSSSTLVIGSSVYFLYDGKLTVPSSYAELVVNEGQIDFDFRVEGDGDTHLLFTDAGNDRVGIGTSSPAYKLDVSGQGRFVHSDGACGLFVEDEGGSGIHIGDCAYSGGSTYAGITHSNYTGSQEYMMISQGDHTYLSAKQDYAVIIRGGNNNSKCEIRVYDADVDGQNGVVINEGGWDRDTRIEGTGDQNLFKVDASADSIGIGTNTPAYKLEVVGTFSADSINVNDAFTLPTGDGTNGQVMTTDGSGNVSWTNQSGSAGGVSSASYIYGLIFR